MVTLPPSSTFFLRVSTVFLAIFFSFLSRG